MKGAPLEQTLASNGLIAFCGEQSTSEAALMLIDED
jgi:hypothetical protein